MGKRFELERLKRVPRKGWRLISDLDEGFAIPKKMTPYAARGTGKEYTKSLFQGNNRNIRRVTKKAARRQLKHVIVED